MYLVKIHFGDLKKCWVNVHDNINLVVPIVNMHGGGNVRDKIILVLNC